MTGKLQDGGVRAAGSYCALPPRGGWELTVSFFDDDDEPTRVSSRPRRPAQPRQPAHPAGGAPPDRQTARTRQIAALAIGILLLVIVVLGVNGCINSRGDRKLKDYNRDVTAIAGDSDAQVSKPFFQLLTSGSSAGEDLGLQVNQIRLAAEEDAKRARELSTPSDMRGAQQGLLLAMNLRAQAFTAIAERLQTAQGRGQQAEKAVREIAGQMKLLLASDVVYSQRTVPLIKQALDQAGIEGQSVQASQSLPGYKWLAPATITSALGGGGAGTTATTNPTGRHGHGLTSTTIGTTALTPGGPVNRVTRAVPLPVTVKFQNQGESDERNVVVTVKLTSAGGKSTSAEKKVLLTKLGLDTTVTIPLTRPPAAGTAAQLTVKVNAVPGEKNTDNNQSTYTVLLAS